MPVPPDKPEECLHHAYAFVRSRKKTYGLSAEEVDDAAGELTAYMISIALPHLDRTRTLAAQRRWWHRTVRGEFMHWLRDRRNLIRVPGLRWEAGDIPAYAAIVPQEQLAAVGSTVLDGWEDRVCDMVDLRACLKRAGLTAEEKECLSRSVLDGNPPDGMTRQHWYYVTGKARKKLREARNKP